jgi:hypothetical protein
MFGHGSVEAEHLLLALFADRDGIVGHVLSDLGITIEPMRNLVRERLGRGSGPQIAGPMPLSTSAMELIVEARNAVRTIPTARGDGGEPQLGTEHLLLAATSVRESGAFTLLRELGADPDMIWFEVKSRVPTPGGIQAGGGVVLSHLGSVPITAESQNTQPILDMNLADTLTQRLLAASLLNAREERRSTFGLRDLLRAITLDTDASRLLADLGVDNDVLRQRLDRESPASE